MKIFKLVKVVLFSSIFCLSVFANSNSDLSQDPISLRMKEIPLPKLVEVFSLSQGVNLLNWKIVPDTVLVDVDLGSVPAAEVFAHILRCGGLTYVQYENGIELMQEKYIEGKFHCKLYGYGKVEEGKLVYRD